MPELNPQMQQILDDLADVAVNAKLVGGPGVQLSADLSALIEAYSSETPTGPVTSHVDADDIQDDWTTDDDDDELDESHTQRAVGPDATQPVEQYDALAALGADIDDIADGLQRDAMPQGVTLIVRREDGLPVDPTTASRAVDLVLPSIVAVTGPLTAGTPVIGEQDEDTVARVPLTVAEDNLGAALAMLGAGRDGFNAAVPIAGVGTILITSLVGQPADAELAAELGTLPPDLPEVPDGQHPINGVLTAIEQEFGVRPQAQREFTVRYSKDNGQPLSYAEVEQILAHPVSRGLDRLGRHQFLEVTPGETASVKNARFVLLADGEIDLATIALAATAYRGTFDFGGTIGLVSANAEAQLVGVDADIPA
jgi:hypothetical protein